MSKATVFYVVFTDPQSGRRSDVACAPDSTSAATHLRQLVPTYGQQNLGMEARSVSVVSDAGGNQLFPPKAWG